jgi:hypothetical protein
LQIHFLKERQAKLEVAYENDTNTLHRQNGALNAALIKTEQTMANLEVKLTESIEQVHMAQEHNQGLQEIIRRDQVERERLL